MPNYRDTNCEATAAEQPISHGQTQAHPPTINNDDFLDTDISDLPLPDLPVKRSKPRKPARDERVVRETVTSAEETFVTPPPLSLPRTPIKAKKPHTRNSSLPRSFRQRNEARAGYLLRKQQRMKTSSAEDLLSFEKRTMRSSSRMQYGSQVDKPRYLFGETSTLHSTLSNSRGSRHCLSDDKHAAADFDDEIFLNKSGWVQVKQRDTNEGGRSSRFDDNNSSSTSKLEDLMLRNEARKTVAMQNFYQKGYLPVTRNAFGKVESPPPMTPIISPPPAFQDASAAAAAAGRGGGQLKARNGKQQQIGGRVHLTVSDTDYHHLPHHQRTAISSNGNGSNNSNKNPSGGTVNNGGSAVTSNNNNKGMVFSRSFEYDNRKMNTDYSEVFSKSFEYDLSTAAQPPAPLGPSKAAPASSKLQQSASLLQIQRERMPAFSNLTGNSPNYLTKKEWGPYRQTISPMAAPPTTTPVTGSAGLLTSRSRDTSPNQAKMVKSPMYPTQSPANSGSATGRKAYVSPGGPGRGVSEKMMKADRYQSFDEQVGRSRRAQFSRLRNESSNSSSSRSVDVATVNRRLNSCDSGARSGKIDKHVIQSLFSCTDAF